MARDAFIGACVRGDEVLGGDSAGVALPGAEVPGRIEAALVGNLPGDAGVGGVYRLPADVRLAKAYPVREGVHHVIAVVGDGEVELAGGGRGYLEDDVFGHSLAAGEVDGTEGAGDEALSGRGGGSGETEAEVRGEFKVEAGAAGETLVDLGRGALDDGGGGGLVEAAEGEGRVGSFEAHGDEDEEAAA
jgi:hypothetical protein